MNKFFDVEGPFIVGLTKFADIFILNILMVLCSLPIITAGASVTATYYVMLKMVKDEDCYIAKSFFRSFKQNFKQATVIWLIMLAIGTVLFLDMRVMNGAYADVVNVTEGMAKVMSILLMTAAIFYSFTIIYVFPVLARFDNTIKNTMKNALLMSIRHFPSTIIMVVITFIPVVFILFDARAFILIIIAFGLIAYINSKFLVKIFKLYMPEEEIVSDEDFEIKEDNE